MMEVLYAQIWLRSMLTSSSSSCYFTGYNSVVRVPRGASRLKVVQVSTNPGDYDTNFLG